MQRWVTNDGRAKNGRARLPASRAMVTARRKPRPPDEFHSPANTSQRILEPTSMSDRQNPPSQFSLRMLFVVMTITAVACAVIRFLLGMPILGLWLMFYVPLMAFYALIRGPSLLREWRTVRQDYDTIAQQRRAILKEAEVKRSEESKPTPDSHSSG